MIHRNRTYVWDVLCFEVCTSCAMTEEQQAYLLKPLSLVPHEYIQNPHFIYLPEWLALKRQKMKVNEYQRPAKMSEQDQKNDPCPESVSSH